MSRCRKIRIPFVDSDYTGNNNAGHSKVDRELCVQNQNDFGTDL